MRSTTQEQDGTTLSDKRQESKGSDHHSMGPPDAQGSRRLRIQISRDEQTKSLQRIRRAEAHRRERLERSIETKDNLVEAMKAERAKNSKAVVLARLRWKREKKAIRDDSESWAALHAAISISTGESTRRSPSGCGIAVLNADGGGSLSSALTQPTLSSPTSLPSNERLQQVGHYGELRQHSQSPELQDADGPSVPLPRGAACKHTTHHLRHQDKQSEAEQESESAVHHGTDNAKSQKSQTAPDSLGYVRITDAETGDPLELKRRQWNFSMRPTRARSVGSTNVGGGGLGYTNDHSNLRVHSTTDTQAEPADSMMSWAGNTTLSTVSSPSPSGRRKKRPHTIEGAASLARRTTGSGIGMAIPVLDPRHQQGRLEPATPRAAERPVSPFWIPCPQEPPWFSNRPASAKETADQSRESTNVPSGGEGGGWDDEVGNATDIGHGSGSAFERERDAERSSSQSRNLSGGRSTGPGKRVPCTASSSTTDKTADIDGCVRRNMVEAQNIRDRYLSQLQHMIMAETAEENRRAAAVRFAAGHPLRIRRLQLRHEKERAEKRALISWIRRDIELIVVQKMAALGLIR